MALDRAGCLHVCGNMHVASLGIELPSSDELEGALRRGEGTS